jgi:hypothetical protein
MRETEVDLKGGGCLHDHGVVIIIVVQMVERNTSHNTRHAAYRVSQRVIT